MKIKLVFGVAILYLALLGAAGFQNAYARSDTLGMFFCASSIFVIIALVKVWKNLPAYTQEQGKRYPFV